nr:protein kinase-like domain, concanavalin A-like lectin/glucanase domain protein [Tanacetum cinerariifolium]
MASQDARLYKFEAEFKQQQSKMTNKIDTVLKSITDRIASTTLSDTVKNLKLGTHPVSSTRSYPTMDPQCSTTKENEEEERDSLESHYNSFTPPNPSISFLTEKVLKLNSLFESLRLVPPSPNAELVCTKEEDGDVMFIEIIRNDDDSRKEEPKVEGATTEEPVVEYFDTFPTRDELTYHRRPFIEISNMTHDPPEGVVRFIRGIDGVTYKMPHKIEQYNSISNLEKEHTKSVYLRNEEDKRRGVEYVMSKILGFYKECLELGPEYLTGIDNEGEVM